MSTKYQVSLEWGRDGLAAAGDAAVVVAAADRMRAESLASEHPDACVVTIETAGQVAARLLAEQESSGARLPVAIIAAGSAWPDGSLRPLAGDQLAAGALVDALAELGIDFHSPSCAVAVAAFTGLRLAAGSLVRAEEAQSAG